MARSLFTDREFGPRPRVSEEIPAIVWEGIFGLIYSRAVDGWFGRSYPEKCGDGRGICGSDWQALETAIRVHDPQSGTSREIRHRQQSLSSTCLSFYSEQ
jgi:hypothetical protein